MKGVISLLFLFFLSISAQSAPNCSALFSNYTDVTDLYDEHMEAIKPLQFETELRAEVRSKKLLEVVKSRTQELKNNNGQSYTVGVRGYTRLNENKFLPASKKIDTSLEEKNLRDALLVMQSFYKISESIRKLDDDITYVKFFEEVSESNVRRFAEVEAGVLLRIAELLAAKGISYYLNSNKIYIRRDSGDHYINKLVKRINEKNDLQVPHVDFSFSVRDLVGRGAGGIYWNNTQEINLHPRILLQKSFFQEGVALHEYTHFLDLVIKKIKSNKPYHPSITIKTTDPIVIGKLSIYKKGFSIDELRGYRTSIRFTAHEALTAKGPLEFQAKYEDLYRLVQSQIIFSEVSKKVFNEYLQRPELMNDPSYTKTVVFSEKEEYIIDQEQTHDPKTTYELVSFTLDLYNLLDSKLKEYENKSDEEKYKLIKKIAFIMSIPEVKRMNGNYPTIESIENHFENL